MLADEQSGLQTHIAATESVTLCVRRKSWRRSWNLISPIAFPALRLLNVLY